MSMTKASSWLMGVVIILALIGAIALLGRPALGQLTTEQKLDDIRFLINILEENYPYFGVAQRKGIDWAEISQQAITGVQRTKSDLEFIEVVKSTLEALKQGHTQLMLPPFLDMAAAGYASLPKEWGRTAWADVFKQPQVVNRSAWLKNNYATPPMGQGSPQGGSTSGTTCYAASVVRPGQVAYVKLNSFDANSIQTDQRLLRAFFESVRNFPYLIIDIRGNPGGATSYWTENIVKPLLLQPLTISGFLAVRGGAYAEPFLALSSGQTRVDVSSLPAGRDYPPELHKDFTYCVKTDYVFQADSVGFSGDIYLLVDGVVYSAAEGFAVFAKSSGWATLVGTPTGGDGIGIDPLVAALPHSGLVFRFPAIMGLNPDGSSNDEYGTQPDVLIGKDEDALSVTLKLIEERSKGK